MNQMSEVEILFVDDDPNDVELVLRELKKQNLANKVHVLSDGESALDFVFRRGEYVGRVGALHPKVIMLDVKLPRMSGIDVLLEIKGNPDTATIPVVMLTSSAEEPDIQSCASLGANSYIVKPVDFETFHSAISMIGYYWVLLNENPLH